jgi:hypothetical protein
MADKAGYQAVVGSVLHLVQCTRPDLALAIGALAAYCSALSVVHHAALVVVVRDVSCTASWGSPKEVIELYSRCGATQILQPAGRLEGSQRDG